MIALLVNDTPLDLPPDELGTSLAFSIRNLQKFGTAQGAASLTVKLPATPANVAAFGAVQEPSVVPDSPADGFRIRERNTCRLYDDGQLVLEGFARLLSFSETEYQIQLLGGNAAWGELLRNKPLRDVNLNAAPWKQLRWQLPFTICHYVESLSHTGFVQPDYDGTLAAAAAVRANFQTACYPYFQYNSAPFNGLPAQPLPLTALRPAAFVGPLLQAHFEDIGWQLKSDWLTEQAGPTGDDPLVLPFSLENWDRARDIPEEGVLEIQLALSTDGPIADTFGNALDWDTVLLDTPAEVGTYVIDSPPSGGVGLGDRTLQTWIPKRPGVYCLTGRVLAEDVNGASIINFIVDIRRPDGTQAVQLFVKTFNNLSQLDLTFEETVTIPPDYIAEGYAVVFSIGGALNSTRPKAGTFVDIRHKAPVIEGATYDLRATLPDLTVLELLKDLTALFNLRFDADPATRTVFMEPYPRFYQDGGPELDPHIDRSEGTAQAFLSAGLPATQLFSYKSDDDDLTLSTLEEATGEVFGTGTVLNPDATATGERTTELKHVVPTAEESVPFLTAPLPTFRREDFPAFTTKMAPRVLFVRATNLPTTHGIAYAFPVADCNGAAFTSGTYLALVYQRAYFDSPGTRLRFDGPQGLLERYYLPEFNALFAGRRVEVAAVLTRISLPELLQFRRIFRLAGQRVVLEKLNRYRPGGPRQVSLELLQLP